MECLIIHLPGEFEREDLARAWLLVMANDLAQVTHMATLQFPTKHVFFCGNFVSHPLMRQEVAAEFGSREAQHAAFQKVIYRYI